MVGPGWGTLVEDTRPSIAGLYDAKDWIERLHPGKEVNEFTMTTTKGKTLKHWEIVDKATTQAEGCSDPPF